MKKNKLILLVLLFFTVGFIYTETINAEMTDEDCRACAERYGGRCGYCRACALNDSGECIANKNFSSSENVQTCTEYKDSTECRTSPDYACLWNDVVIDGKSYGYCNVDNLLYVKCGDTKDIPHQVPQIISFAINFLKILTPIILIFISIISLLKAISSSNEDEIKKAQKGLIRKVIAAVMVFFIISIVQFVIVKVADSDMLGTKEDGTTNLSDCLNCFLNNNCKESVYFKTYVGSELIETPITEISK